MVNTFHPAPTCPQCERKIFLHIARFAQPEHYTSTVCVLLPLHGLSTVPARLSKPTAHLPGTSTACRESQYASQLPSVTLCRSPAAG